MEDADCILSLFYQSNSSLRKNLQDILRGSSKDPARFVNQVLQRIPLRPPLIKFPEDIGHSQGVPCGILGVVLNDSLELLQTPLMFLKDVLVLRQGFP